MTTRLDKPVYRAVTIDGAEYTVAIDARGVWQRAKGKRTWRAALWDVFPESAATRQAPGDVAPEPEPPDTIEETLATPPQGPRREQGPAREPAPEREPFLPGVSR